ncbi:hypothetical protein [Mycolicibacterium helvum]|uniref:PE family protein n=1 Tax=Mycolicibacterium helvum TaxID=1534349 RepID=A0A7I7T2U1_9MYCO|nr:hypothetical protein [Mycolicibacterium helvum]BBY63233.1 hypothetical protein MHEL_14760 [Mycolicibacterium helvum]
MVTRAKHGRRRPSAVRTWLGAGVLAVGVGTALAAAPGVAQADTGDHSAAGSASASKHDAGPSAGSKRAVGVAAAASRKPAATARPSQATGKPAAAGLAVIGPTTSQTRESSATVNTPIGPITVLLSATIPIPFTNGPAAINVKATTPIGNAEGSLAGSQTVIAGLPPVNEIALNEGNLVVPPQVAFLVSATGAAVTGGLSLSNSANSFASAVHHGDLGGALQTLISAAPNFANAVLFGHQTLTIPLVSSIDQQAQSVELHVPFGGWFAPLRPLSVSWSTYTYVDETGVAYKVDGGNLEFAGTKFGGVVPAFVNLFVR